MISMEMPPPAAPGAACASTKVVERVICLSRKLWLQQEFLPQAQ
jgi:hypothetical protein